MATLQKAIKVGSSVAVVIPKRSLKALGVKPGTALALEVDEDLGTLTVSRANKTQWETVADFTDMGGVSAEDVLAGLRKLDGSHRKVSRRA